MREEIKVPSVGESVTEGVIAVWSKKDGDFVEPEEPLFDLETDKVTMPVNSPYAGRLSILAKEGQKVKIGEVVATIDTSARREAAAGASTAAPSAARPATAEARKVSAGKQVKAAEKPPGGKPQAAPAAAVEELAPSVRRLLQEHGLDPADIPATGKAGRLTKEDVVRYLDQQKAREATEAPSAAEPAFAKAGSVATPTSPVSEEEPAPPSPPRSAATPLPALAARGERRQTRTPMSPLRVRVAQRMLAVQQTTAMVTTFNEADMTSILSIRERYKDTFEKRYGVRLGFMSFFIKASVDALRTVPALNAFIDGEDIVQNHFYDIGVAVSTDKGLVVPIIRDCDRLAVPELERAIQDFAQRARDRKLTLDDLSGGCFSISNGGVFGSLLSTPMLNPPQSGILGIHAIKERPVVVDGRVEVRPMMYLALTYDHRVVDGREGVTFLKRIVECIENPERMVLEV